MQTKSYFIFGFAIAVCFVLGYRAFSPESSSSVRSETTKPALSDDKSVSAGSVASQKAPPVAPTKAADWEIKFCEIANDSSPLQEESLRDLSATIPDDQIHDALDKLTAEQSDPAMTLVVFLGERWAEKSPVAAAQWAAAHMSDDSYGHNIFSKIMVPWAQKDLASAVAWVQQLPADGNKTAAAFSLATEAAKQKEAVTAIKLTAYIPPGPTRDDLLNYSVQEWATTDLNSAVAWVGKTQDPALRDSMLGKIAVNVGAQDPAAGAKLVTTAMSDGPARNNAVVTIVRFWASATPSDAAAWVTQFPEGSLRDLAMGNLVDAWGKNNLADAGQWVNQLPPGHSRDIAENTLEQLQK